MAMIRFSYIAIAAAALFFCGCSIFPEPHQDGISYYDLKMPVQIKSCPIEIEQFANFSGERQRMLRRENDLLVVGSDFHKWMQTPGSLLSRYLRLAFRSDLRDSARNIEQAVFLRGDVLTFEINNGNAMLGVRYQLKYGRQTCSKTVMISEKMNGSRPEAFAEAMSRAAEKFARMVAAEAEKLINKRK